MIVIMSDNDDQSTNGVIDWINYYNKNFIRINPTDIISHLKIDESFNCSFIVNDKLVDLNDVDAFWYRRGNFNLLTSQINHDSFPFKNEINSHLKNENRVIAQFILSRLHHKNALGNYFNTDANKFSILLKAKNIGLAIPETIVTSSKEELIAFRLKHQKVITKCNSEVINRTKEGVSIISYTKEVGEKEIEFMPNSFSPSLFQKAISKKFELRIFFIDDDFFSSAIFSQLDMQTAVDFRVYNHTKPNRVVPFKLPIAIKKKLSILMKECHYNTGSIDLIVSDRNEFIFLEVNPVGQFDWVAMPCNFQLQKRIAQKLCFLSQ